MRVVITNIWHKKLENVKIAGGIYRAAYIPFNGGMIVCLSCCEEWEKLGKPKTIVEYHEAIYKREDYQTDLIAKK